MSTGLTPIRRHGRVESISRALAVLTVLLLAGIAVLVEEEISRVDLGHAIARFIN